MLAMRHSMGQNAPLNGTDCATQWDKLRHSMGQIAPILYLKRLHLHALPLPSTEGGGGAGRERDSLEVARSCLKDFQIERACNLQRVGGDDGQQG